MDVFAIVCGRGTGHVLVERQSKGIAFNLVGHGNAIACCWVMYGIAGCLAGYRRVMAVGSDAIGSVEGGAKTRTL